MYRRLGYFFGMLAFATAGAYLFVYLFRWEWNRAVMAGLFFIAAEVALVGAAILERIKAVEKHISAIGQTDHSELLARLQENPAPPKERFAWLTEGDTNVFIPFLMGAGLVASGIAWVLERVARATAKPVLERGLAMKLTPLALPEGGLLGGPTTVVRPVSSSRRTLHRQLAALALAILAGTVGIDVLSDATQTRPDVLVPGSQSLVTLEVRTNGKIKGLEAAMSLWGTCQGTVPNNMNGTGMQPAGYGRFTFVLEPALGKNGERRLRGCLTDATIDNIQSRVLSVKNSGGG